MKKLTFFSFLVLFLPQPLWSTTDLYLANQEFMATDKAVTLWGHKPFSAEEFKKGTLTVKSSMAASLIEGKAFIGKTPKQVREILGDPTGYFWSKDIPAYFLNDSKKKNHETWQLVFLPDSKGKIGEVRIHKNCCSKDGQYDPARLPKILKELDNSSNKVGQ